jgi:hypothetical protein
MQNLYFLSQKGHAGPHTAMPKVDTYGIRVAQGMRAIDSPTEKDSKINEQKQATLVSQVVFDRQVPFSRPSLFSMLFALNHPFLHRPISKKHQL